MRNRSSGRVGRLFDRLKSVTRGEELKVGIRSSADIYSVAGRLGLLVNVMRTDETALRDDGVTVPVYLVSFR